MHARVSRDARRTILGAALCASLGLGSLALPRAPHAATRLRAIAIPPAPAPRVVLGPEEDAPARPPPRRGVRTTDEGFAVVVEPRAVREASDPPMPVTVVLHGICGHAENICRPFATAASARGWLVCPRASNKCADGGAMWLPSERNPAVFEDILARVDAAHAHALAVDSPRTLVGFSLGATAALDAANRAHGEWDALVLLSADVHPDAKALHAAGVRTVLLAAGEKDMMYPVMRAAADHLARGGMRTRFMTLGPVGHTLPPEMAAWSEYALAWVRGEGDAL
jgi:predicted esterase